MHRVVATIAIPVAPLLQSVNCAAAHFPIDHVSETAGNVQTFVVVVVVVVVAVKIVLLVVCL